MAEEKKKAVEKAAEVKEEMVKIKLPRMGKNDSDVFVSVNERTWLIQRGVEVEVPACVEEVLRNQERMQEEAYAFDSEVQK